MSVIDLIIEERAVDLGDFMVGRLLPFRRKRAVGPFVFIDHIGPAKMNESENVDVRPHPHIGLSTLTYLFEGAIMHRDSLGNEVEIKPGAVNWMTAGHGVVHSERTPEYLRNSRKKIHGFQIWVALPKEVEETTPSFAHVEAHEIPDWEQDGLNIRLIAGEAFGKKSPVPVYSNLYFIEIKSQAPQTVTPGNNLYGESALFVLEGSISSKGITYEPNQLLIGKNNKLCEFEMGANSTVFIFGGNPFPEEHYIDWNFVSSRKERLKQAAEDWIKQNFPKVPGETEFIPYPGQEEK